MVTALELTQCFITVLGKHQDHSSANSNSLVSHLSTQRPGSRPELAHCKLACCLWCMALLCGKYGSLFKMWFYMSSLWCKCKRTGGLTNEGVMGIFVFIVELMCRRLDIGFKACDVLSKKQGLVEVQRFKVFCVLQRKPYVQMSICSKTHSSLQFNWRNITAGLCFLII